MITLIITVHNQEEVIQRVVHGAFKNLYQTYEVIIIFDGCTDNSKQIVEDYIKLSDKFIRTYDLDNVFETKANNFALQRVATDYAIIVQDDCIINDYGYDKLLLEPFQKYPEVFAVSGRNAHDISPDQYGTVYYTNETGWGTSKNDPNTFYIREVVNRGPLMLKMDVVRELNYFDEAFCPQNGDDHDLCLRASRLGYICGCRPIQFTSKSEWGGTRKGDGTWIRNAIEKNMRIIHDRHLDLISVLHWDNFDERKLT